MKSGLRIWICLLSISFLRAQTPGSEMSQEKAIRELVAKYAAARATSDVKGIEALFTGDADQLVSTGEWRKGRDALVRGMLESSKQNAGARTITVETVRVLAPGVAIADARYEIAATSASGARHMWSSFLAVRTANGWRIAAIRNMLPAK